MAVTRRRRRRIIASQSDRSVTDAQSVVGRVRELWEPARAARAQALYLQHWHDADIPMGDKPTMPDKAPHDMRKIAETGITPNARMVVNQVSQQMRIEGIRAEDSTMNDPAWQIFTRNGMVGKQVPLTKAALTHGLAYELILPATGRLDGLATALVRPRSALRGTAFYRDDFDEFAEVYLDVTKQVDNDGDEWDLIELVDDGALHRLSCKHDDPTTLEFITTERHDMGFTPVQRHGYIDLDGIAAGEIGPLIGLLKRIDQDTVDRLVVQRFASWVVRTIAGMKEPLKPEDQEALDAWLSAGDFLSSDNEKTKFGHIPATPMDGHIKAREADVRDLAGTSQVPAYRLLGLSDNIGADAIKAADASLDSKADELKTVFGEQRLASMRMAGAAAGNTELAGDFSSRVQWATISNASLQSLAQGLQMLYDDGKGVPWELLWKHIPDWSQVDTKEAIRLREKYQQEQQDREMLVAAMSGQGDSGGNSGGAGSARSGTSAGAGSAR